MVHGSSVDGTVVDPAGGQQPGGTAGVPSGAVVDPYEPPPDPAPGASDAASTGGVDGAASAVPASELDVERLLGLDAADVSGLGAPSTAGRADAFGETSVPVAPEAAPSPFAGLSIDDPDDEEPAPAPPVVLVLVAHDPGEWFDETLRSIADQDYPALSVLVVDAESADAVDVRDRVATVLPDAHLRRLDRNPGFATAANEALVAVQGAAFLLFCHDDVRLAPDAVRLLVEEAFRSNAGVVGPKLVDWHDPRRLLAVGMGADRFGHPAPYVERGDLDQEQHDAVRDVFFIPGAATLVRADLFEALGGFDDVITFHGEDLDLCWRAHVAGARVIVNPAAVVAHLEALGVRRPIDDRRRLQARHRLRTMRASDTFGTRIRAVPEAFVLSFAEIVQAVVLGHFRRARDIASAWTWNARNSSSMRARRQSLAAVRRVDDGEVHAFQSRGSARLSWFMRTRVARSEAAAGGREFVSNLRDIRSATSFLVWCALALFLLLGSREIVLGGVPVVGDFVRFLSPGQMLDRWTSGWQSVGLGSTAPAPTGFGVLGAAGVALFGGTGLLRGLLILGMWPLGALGMWRFTRPIASTRARLVSTVVYVAIPLAANAMAQGQWGTLVAYAALPWVLSQFVAASGLSPFGPLGDGAGPGVRERPLVHRIVAAGLVVALASMIEPSFLLLSLGCAVVLVVAGLFTGQGAGGGRLLLVGVGSSAIATVLLLPWSAGLIAGWRSFLGAGSNGGFPLALGDVLRFGTGPFGTGVIGWALLVTAALPLLIGRSWRLAWAVRAWLLAATGFGLAWSIGQGWLVDWLPAPSLLLVPAALGVALSAGLGMAAFEADLPDYHFGWRQILSLLAATAFVVALVPALGSALSGRWALPRGDFDRSLSFLGDDAGVGDYRVLWIGDAAAIPTGSWRLDAPAVDDLGEGRALAFATTGSSTPSIAQYWPGSLDGATSHLGDALRTAAGGGTARLGAQLAPMAVRYIVVPVAPAPDPYARSRAKVPVDLLSMLDAQLDLESITVNPGVRVYRNSAWVPGLALLPAGTELPDEMPAAVGTSGGFDGATAALTERSSFDRASGEIAAPGVLYSALAGDRWRLQVNGSDTDRSTVLGWANAYAVGEPGAARLSYDTSPLTWLLLLGQVLLWAVAIGYLLRNRVRVEEGNVLVLEAEPEPEPEPEPPVVVAVAADAPAIDDVLASITGVVPVIDIDAGTTTEEDRD